jgi:hypothetical protein
MTISLDVQIKKTKENSDEIESKSFWITYLYRNKWST